MDSQINIPFFFLSSFFDTLPITLKGRSLLIMFLFWYNSSVIDVLSRVVYFQKNRDYFGKRETSTNTMLGKSSKKHMVSLISV